MGKADSNETILIEQTSKPLKLIRLVGILLVVVAIVLAAVFSDTYGPTSVGYALGGVVGLAGILCCGYGTFLSWWHHG